MIIIGIFQSTTMIFSELVADLQSQLKKDLAQIRFLLKKNPAMAYTRIVEIGKEVGKTYNIKLIINFPKQGKIEAWLMPPADHPSSGRQPWVIFAHGNGELIDFWPHELKPFTGFGVGVMLVEYPGYGRRLPFPVR